MYLSPEECYMINHSYPPFQVRYPQLSDVFVMGLILLEVSQLKTQN